ncbi:MAG TPA: GNAT family N-acetyltransferase [Candidatus Caenarcaniphilales bacterium]|nr:GNAT family N-acetyltransferase [Candidatus Caenarcaniphilales bacterium]
MLEFASDTWDGWDYIPHAWPVWLAAQDGVLLVAEPGVPADGSPPLDAAGAELSTERPIAVARVALLSPSEAWLEGIRVHPRVRGMDVATDLQLAELEWAAAQNVSVVRYATGQRNEGSHRLGARHGFQLLSSLRTYWWSETGADQDRHDEPTGFDDDVRANAAAVRRRLLERLGEAGLVLAARDAHAVDGWWRRVEADGVFRSGHRLYERRAWALQELTRDRFFDHARNGEVLVWPRGADAWAAAVLPADVLPAEDVSLHLAVLVGESRASAELADRVRRLAGQSIRFRLSEDAAVAAAAREALGAVGFHAREWTLDILGRPLGGPQPRPEIDPSSLVLVDVPLPTLRAPDLGSVP